MLDRRRGAVLLLALAVVGLLVVPAGAEPPAARSTTSTEWITSHDGVRLRAVVQRPASLPASARTPVVVVPSVYYGGFSAVQAGAPTSPVPTARLLTDGLLDAGYTVVAVDLRGAGASGGCLDYGGDDDAADVDAMVAWAASQQWSSGRVALAALSFDGAAVLAGMRLAHPALDAVFLIAPLSPYGTIWTHGVRSTSPLPFKPVLSAGSAAALDLLGPPVGADPSEHLSGLDPSCTALAVAGLEDPDPSHPFWVERDVVGRLSGTRIPTLLSFGFEDDASLTGHLLPLWQALAGPRRAWFGQVGHTGANDDDLYGDDLKGNPYVGRRGFHADYLAFLDQHLRGGPGPASPPVVVQEAAGGWRGEGQWPPPSTERLNWTVRPGAYVDGPGNFGDRRLGPEEAAPLAPHNALVGRGTWTFSQPLPSAVHLAGSPVVVVDAEAGPGAHVVPLLYDVAPDGTAQLITRGAALLDASGPTSVPLQPQDWRVAAGHRVGLLLSGADDSQYRSDGTGLAVAVTAGSLTLPVLRGAPGARLSGGENRFIRMRQPFTVDEQTVRAATVEQPLR